MDSAIQSMGDLAVSRAMMPAAMSRLAANGAEQKIDEAAKDFESMFMAQMLQPMFETVGVDPVFGGGHGEEVMRSFLVQEYGKIMARHSHLGIADSVKKEMIMVQEKAAHAAAPDAAASAQGAAP